MADRVLAWACLGAGAAFALAAVLVAARGDLLSGLVCAYCADTGHWGWQQLRRPRA